jgi:hypothetical protein
VSQSRDIVNILLAARAPVTVDRIAAVLSVGPRIVSALLRELHQTDRVSRARLQQNRYEYWMSADQMAVEQSKRVEKSTPRPVDSLNVAILTDSATLAGRLFHLERLLLREALSSDATLRAIAVDYRTTLAAVRVREALIDEVPA